MSIICTCFFFKYSRQFLAELFFTLDEYLPRNLLHLIIIVLNWTNRRVIKKVEELYVIKQISVAVMAVHQNPLWPIAPWKTEMPLTCSVSSQTFQKDPLLDLHRQWKCTDTHRGQREAVLRCDWKLVLPLQGWFWPTKQSRQQNIDCISTSSAHKNGL